MRFIEWLRLDELNDISQLNSSGVELEEDPNIKDRYTYKFDDFVVLISRLPESRLVGDKKVDGIWNVSFTRGGMYGLTGVSGGGGTAVYGKVLGAVKKLTEIKEVNGLKFSGTEAKQDIMYDKFLKTLGGFTHVGDNIYIRDEIIKANASGEDLELYKGVSEKRDNQMHNLKVMKNASRNKSLIGKITGYSDSGKVLPAIITGFQIANRFTLFLLVWDGTVARNNALSGEGDYKDEGGFKKIVSPSLIDPSLISSLVKNYPSPTRSGVTFDGSTYDFGFKKETA
jgi:hypothetical protein